MPGKLRVTLRKSPISYTARAHGTLRAIGLRRIGQTVEVKDDAAMRGQVRAVRFLVEVEELPERAAATSKATPTERPTFFLANSPLNPFVRVEMRSICAASSFSNPHGVPPQSLAVPRSTSLPASRAVSRARSMSRRE